MLCFLEMNREQNMKRKHVFVSEEKQYSKQPLHLDVHQYEGIIKNHLMLKL